MLNSHLTIRGTAISVVAPLTDKYHVIYQLEDRMVQQRDEANATTTVNPSRATISSPLASISWNNGNEVRVSSCHRPIF